VANEGFDLIKLEFGENWARALTKLEFSFVSYEDLLNASKLYGSNQWIFFKNKLAFNAFDRIYSDNRLFENTFLCFVGLQTSHDKLYFLHVTHEDKKHYHGVIELNQEAIQVEKKYFKPMLKGKDVHRYAPLSTDIYVFFPYEIKNEELSIVDLQDLKEDYPLTYQYVKSYEKEFKGRESGKAKTMKHWHAYIYPKNLTKFEQMKISSMEICSKHPNVTLNYNNLYHNTKVYSWVKKDEVKESYEFFLSIANSSLMWWFLKNTGDTLQGDARTLKTNYLNPFPLPKVISKETDKFFKKKVENIIKLKASGKETIQHEKEIDALVCKLYELTYEEAKEVDPKIELNESEYNSLKLQ